MILTRVRKVLSFFFWDCPCLSKKHQCLKDSSVQDPTNLSTSSSLSRFWTGKTGYNIFESLKWGDYHIINSCPFSRTRKPFLWNVIVRKDRAPVSPGLWPNRTLEDKAHHAYQSSLSNFHVPHRTNPLTPPLPDFPFETPSKFLQTEGRARSSRALLLTLPARDGLKSVLTTSVSSFDYLW